MESQVLTVGLFSLGIACVGGGFWFAFWHAAQLHKIKDEILSEVRRTHAEPADERVRELETQVAALAGRLRELELHVERSFISKATANLVFDRMEKGLSELRTAIDSSRTSTEARLIRIESHLAPSAMLPPVQRHHHP